MQIKLSRALTHTLNSFPRGRLAKEPITHSCNVPWHHVTVDANSDIFLCSCDGWLPVPVGKVNEFDSLDSIWNSEVAKVLQKSIEDKQYTWCAVQHCGIQYKDIDQRNYTLNINLDDSCNLSCPSCRREMRMLDSGAEYETKLDHLNKVISWLEKFDRPIHIILSGNGDPLASKVIRPLVRNYVPKAGQTFTIKTNGLLMKKLLDDSAMKNAITRYEISVDAGSQEVYEKVRRPGKWSVLLENLEWLKQNKKNSLVVLDLVLQRDNFRDLQNYAELCQRFNFAGHVSPLTDWGTWNRTAVAEPDVYTIKNGIFPDHNVADSNHCDYQEFISIINELQHKLRFAPYFSKFFNVTR